MSYTVIYTKSFNGFLRSLLRQGQKKAVQLASQAMTEAGMAGEITSLARTKHGETRLPNVEKYDVVDGHRLVVQLVDGVKKTRAFLFVGSHQDADRWLDSHKDYKWVRSATDGTLEFVRVTDQVPAHVPADRMDLESPEPLLALPLLRVISEAEWQRIALPESARNFASSITSADYERDADGLLSRLVELSNWHDAALVIDLVHHAHGREWSELHSRISIIDGDARPVEGGAAAAAMVAPDNSESFVTFDDEDAQAFFAHASLADWMLFLHPEQKKVATKSLGGPARLRGVSGSGKTCVLVHRARHLARKYREPVLMLTLTESLRRLLVRLADDLCGVERSLISAWTISSFAKQVIHELHPQSSRFYTPLREEQHLRLLEGAVTAARAHEDFARSPMAGMTAPELQVFVRDEMSFIRGRLREDDLDQYLDTKVFQRRGRHLALNESSRRVCMAAVKSYLTALKSAHWLDHEGVVSAAIGAVVHESSSASDSGFRAVLVDEVQDLSHLEIALLASLRARNGQPVSKLEDGLFLAGDGAQTIYKKGFTLRSLGIEVGGRSFALKKNYRNTHEILKAAFGLVEKYEFADVDEENIIRPDAPEFAKRHGRRPVILRCDSTREEGEAVASQVSSLLEMGHVPGQICIIGPSRATRDAAINSLSERSIRNTDLRDDVDFESDNVKVSTIESAKGHEFGAVFVMGLVEKVLPHSDVVEEEMHREASRLYVAMTRARENLYLTYSPTRGYTPSRFLLAVQDDCDEARYREGEWVPVRV
jgi:superfamily I DNA/RNA helicase